MSPIFVPDPGPATDVFLPTTASDCAFYMKLPSDADLMPIETALLAERDAQARVCRTDPYNADLQEALFRRVARNLGMRALPLGVQMDETGGTRIGSNDPEIRRLEGPYRKMPVG